MEKEMDGNTLIPIAAMASVGAGVVGLLVSVRGYKRQVSAQFLLEYTKRVEEIRQSLPPSVWGAHVFPDAQLPEPSDALRLGVLRCLSFIAQLQYFCRTGYIPKQIWHMSQDEFKRILRSQLFIREWKALSPMFASEQRFCRYVARVQQTAEEKRDSLRRGNGQVFVAKRESEYK